MKKRFNDRYITGDLPWDIERPDFNLVQTVEKFKIEPCKALDIGCGTGDNIFWLKQSGFTGVGIEISEKAVEMALLKSEENKIQVDFYVRDIFKDEIPGAAFEFIFDRGCFHTFTKKKQRRDYAMRVHKLLDDGGLWLTLMGNEDDGRLDIGPPKRTALEVVTAVEPFFEILELKQGRFDSNDEIPSKIWICLMRKRKSG